MYTRFSLLFVIIVIIAGSLFWLGRTTPDGSQVQASLISTMDDPPSSEGFAQATDPNALSFPDAFGAHPQYQTEWWYYTGNLQTAEGRPFGFQFTIFRRSLTPEQAERTSEFATSSVYMAHFALTDGENKQFYAHERFQRGGGGVAGAEAVPYRVWLNDWSVEEQEAGRYHLRAAAEDMALELTLVALKPPALHGNNGLSQKSEQVGNASYYYSQSRLESTGTVTVQQEKYEVSGLTWKDHEYGTSALAENAVGWDWFSLQLSDGRELMYFQIRTKDGGVEPVSSGSLILEDSTIIPLARTDIQIEVLDQWTSPDTKGVYPSGWRLTVPEQQIELTLTPLIPNQELRLSAVYWEGAVTAQGSASGQPITARGYVELTGYTGARAPSV